MKHTEGQCAPELFHIKSFYRLIENSIVPLSTDFSEDESAVFYCDVLSDELCFSSIKPCLDFMLGSGRINDEIYSHFREIDAIFEKAAHESYEFTNMFYTASAVKTHEYWLSIRHHARRILDAVSALEKEARLNAELYSSGGAFIKCVHLADFTLKVTTEKRFLFFKRRSEKFHRLALVFIPWKHAQKELAIVLQENLVIKNRKFDNFIKVESFKSTFEIEYPFNYDYEIQDFCGIRAAYENKSFIADVLRERSDSPLEILYGEFPDFSELEFDEATPADNSGFH